MTEDQLKNICKFLVENSNRPLTHFEKEALKEAIDKSNSIEELAAVAVAILAKYGL